MATRQDLSVTRGDTLPIELTIYTQSGEVYKLQGKDALRLTVKSSIDIRAPALIQKIMDATSGAKCELTCSETELDYGSYWYDVELETEDGKRFTVIPPSRLDITAEVTTHDES